MDNKTLETIQNIIGYQFNNKQLLVQAFTRESYAYENPGVAHCEVLEFYGDSVLGITVVKSMCQKYGKIKNKQFISEKDEGELTQIKSSWVDKKHLSRTIKLLDLGKYIRIGTKNVKKGEVISDSLQEDLCESIIGAVAVDCNWNFNVLFKLCFGMLDVTEFSENTVRMLCDWCKDKGYKFPTFTKFTPKENMQENKFYQQVKIAELGVSFIGCDDTVTEAKMAASMQALNYCKKIDMQNEVGKPEITDAINQLQELFHKEYIEKPSFIFTEKKSGWECRCKVANYNDCLDVEKSKKDAKRNATFKMLEQIMDLNLQKK